MQDFQFHHADIVAIEAHARALRAQATRDMIIAASKWVARRFTAGSTATAQNMA